MPDPKKIPPRPEWYDKKVALVLQGGGALGSFQAGVYQALADSPYLPDWVAGISIGAVNAALIAGNAPEKRVERMQTFWERITEPPALWPMWIDQTVASFLGDHRPAGAANALVFGQQGFFSPRSAAEWMLGPRPTSLYDTGALKSTLEELVDFDRINAREMRFSVGAVNVRTGNFTNFDNARTIIRPEHVMASGALPPGFPAVEIDGEHYWDGGLVSNTPLYHVVTSVPRRSRITFQVDLFPARGPLPATIEDVAEREKDIRYSSRTRTVTNTLRQMHDVRHNINLLWEQLSPEQRALPQAKFLLRHHDGYRAADLPAGADAGSDQGLRVQPPHDAGPMGAGVFRCDDDAGCLALAGAGAGGGGVAHLRRAGRRREPGKAADEGQRPFGAGRQRGPRQQRRAYAPRQGRGGMSTAGVLVALVGAYGAVGLVIGVAFLLFAIDRMDPAAVGAYAFRPLLLPGLVLLWPLVLRRWLVFERSG